MAGESCELNSRKGWELLNRILCIYCIKFERKRIKNEKSQCHAKLSDTEVSSLSRDEAHGVSTAGRGHLAHLGPLVRIRIIIQHVSQNASKRPASVPFKSSSYNANNA